MKTHPGAIARLKLGRISLVAAVITLLGAAIGVQDVNAATLTVTTTADTGPDAPAPGSLRAALATASDGDIIDATGIAGIITLMPGGLTTGELLVGKSITILGPGPANLTIDANHLGRVFHITPGLTVTIDGLRVINGLAQNNNFPANAGGGIFNDHSVLTVSNCVLSGNTFQSNVTGSNLGGAIYNNGRSGSAALTVKDCTLTGNSANIGGAIYNDCDDSGSATLTIDHSTLSNNSAIFGDYGGAIFSGSLGSGGDATVFVANSTFTGNSANVGGAICSVIDSSLHLGGATLTITDSILGNNSAIGFGGAIVAFGGHGLLARATISGCRLSGNSAGGGGAIFNGGTAITEIATSTLSGNFARVLGGAIYNVAGASDNARLTIVRSTLSGNSTEGDGGALYNLSESSGSAIALLGDCTLSGNLATLLGGAIVTDTDATDPGTSEVKVFGCTLSGNAAGAVGGIASAGSAEIANTILNDAGGGNLFGNITSFGFNLSTDGGGGYLTATGDQVNKDPLLGPLADNGGPTLTHLPLPGSPAIDQGSSGTLALFEPTDQRGVTRTVDDPTIPNAPFGDGTDIGALEVGLAPPPPPPAQADLLVSLGMDKTSVKQGDQLTYTITVQNVGPDTATNVVVNDTLSSGTTFVSAKANKGSFTAPVVGETGTVTWQLGDLANASQEAAQIQVTVIIKGKDTITNTATVQSDASDPNPANNSAALSVSVGAGGGKGGKK